MYKKIKFVFLLFVFVLSGALSSNVFAQHVSVKLCTCLKIFYFFCPYCKKKVDRSVDYKIKELPRTHRGQFIAREKNCLEKLFKKIFCLKKKRKNVVAPSQSFSTITVDSVDPVKGVVEVEKKDIELVNIKETVVENLVEKIEEKKLSPEASFNVSDSGSSPDIQFKEYVNNFGVNQQILSIGSTPDTSPDNSPDKSPIGTKREIYLKD